MSPRIPVVTLGLSAILGCESKAAPIETGADAGTDADASGEPGTTVGSPGAEGPTTGSTGEPHNLSGDTLMMDADTGSSGTSDTEDTDTDTPPRWCNGFDPETEGFAVLDDANFYDLMDGDELWFTCNGEGQIRAQLFPRFGGFLPEGHFVGIDVVLDVDGFNLNAEGHFFSAAEHQHKVDCSDDHYYGYDYGYISVFPPEGIPALTAIDGKAGHLWMTLHTPDGDLGLEVKPVMVAGIDECP